MYTPQKPSKKELNLWQIVGLLVLIVGVRYYSDQLSTFLLEQFTAPKAAIASTLFVSSI